MKKCLDASDILNLTILVLLGVQVGRLHELLAPSDLLFALDTIHELA